MVKLLTFIQELFESNLIKFMNWIVQVSDLNGVILSTKLYYVVMVTMVNADENEYIERVRQTENERERERGKRKCGNVAAVIQKLKVFFLIRLLNYSHTTAQNTSEQSFYRHRTLHQYTVNSNSIISSHRFAYAIQPGILCIKYKSRLAVLIKEKKFIEEKKFLVVH